MTHSPLTPRAPAHAGRGRSLLTTLAVGLSLLLLIIAGCADGEKPSTPPVQERLSQSPVSKQEKIRIGVYQDTPLMGYLEPTGRRTGFEIDLARGIAEFLGFKEGRIDWVPLTTPQRETALLRGDVDLVVASFSITEDRKERVRFAGPYLVTEQKVLIPTSLAGKITEIGHLRDAKSRVCVTGSSTTKELLLKEGIDVETVRSREDCVTGLLDGRFVAMSSDETILAGLRSKQPDKLTIVDMPFGGPELLGVGIPRHDAALQDVVGHYLLRNYQQERAGQATEWQVAYNKNLGAWLDEDAKQPFPEGVPPLRDHDDREAPREAS